MRAEGPIAERFNSLEKQWGLHWFRRDLRVEGNQALWANFERTGGRTLGLFCFDAKFLGRDDFSHNRFAFFLKTIAALRESLHALGGDLLVIDSLPQEALPKILSFAEKHGPGLPKLLSFGRDYEPFARVRDAEVEELVIKRGVEVYTARDHLLFEPDEIQVGAKNEGFYKVYAPWSRKWAALLETKDGQTRVQNQMSVVYGQPKAKPGRFKLKWSSLAVDGKTLPFSDTYDSFVRENSKHVKIDVPEAGHTAALAELERFRPNLKNYKRDRDVPARYATARISMFLKNGSLTLPQVLGHYKLRGKDFAADSGANKFTKELAWREFYYQILHHRPEVEKEAFNPKLVDLKFENDKNFFNRWCEGTTGVPIVDAAMRELAQTGWITNRVRIITSTFLIKDLLVDWRWGEIHFMHLLLDGDLAANNGNWQWAASTGADSNPYFRVLNPWLQGERFDPQGEYIKRWIPELAKVPAADLHDPTASRAPGKYPEPIVDHQTQKAKAIKMFKK